MDLSYVIFYLFSKIRTYFNLASTFRNYSHWRRKLCWCCLFSYTIISGGGGDDVGKGMIGT